MRKVGYNSSIMMQITTVPRQAKETKKDGFIPAVYYGANQASTSVFVDLSEFTKVLASAGESSSITLKTEHGDEVAMIQDVQIHPVMGHAVHADFYVLEKGQKVHVKTPILFFGDSQAVKDGGVLVKVMQELSIEGESAKLPTELTVDLSKLATSSDVITAGDIKLPAGVTLYHISATDVVASISAAEELGEIAAVDLSTIEVAKKGKKEEETQAE